MLLTAKNCLLGNVHAAKFEQYGMPRDLSREPAHETNTMVLGSAWSEGLTICPLWDLTHSKTFHIECR